MPSPPFSHADADLLRRWGRRGTAAATIAARLALHNIAHAYHRDPVLHDISLSVEPGEILCLLGPSGCGKTTLLRIAAGLEWPTAGRVLVDDRLISGESVFVPPEKRGIGFMFQDYALFPHMTILDNVMFGLNALDRRAAESAARTALGRVGLDSYAASYPHQLSGGEQQRVALARAIVPRPAVLLMDEPFSGLDRHLRDRVRDETLAVLRETRATAVIVTHDPEEAMRMADRIALMRRGRLVQCGTVEDLYLRPVDLLAARFFSELNELDAVAEDNKAHTALGAFAAPGHTAGTLLTVAIRPHSLRLEAEGKGTAAHILSRRFLGEVWLIEALLEGLEVPLKLRLRDHSVPKPGENIHLAVNHTEALVFPRGPFI